jgi:hypothetical protein
VRRQDLAAAAAFSALGLFLLISAAGFPPGVGGLPGPGFFPELIGAVMLLLSVALLLSVGLRRGVPQAPPEPRNPAGAQKALATALALTALYLALWGRIPFALRTALFVAVFLRSQAQPWRASLEVAALLTAAVVAAFEYGLRVHLP